ncbi:acyl carrier protein [Heyndrickxia acidicola]|uniref:Acyl carrier protein n=1 Tax=Heyndrickxia acidicola TaxID=209389 RepID=A0ABU6MJ69_9BACI|nr:acyl carrier protein [Heyndrickxia acidicola]MED1204713.1 acyl carrier protein [Heyndrickxia acidicola]
MEQKLLEICAETFNLDISELSLETTNEDTAEWDSLAQISLVSEIEETFECEIPFDSISEIKKIGDFLEFIQK